MGDDCGTPLLRLSPVGEVEKQEDEEDEEEEEEEPKQEQEQQQQQQQHHAFPGSQRVCRSFVMRRAGFY